MVTAAPTSRFASKARPRDVAVPDGRALPARQVGHLAAIRSVFDEGELDRAAVVAESATTATDGKTDPVECFNLDVISYVAKHGLGRRHVPPIRRLERARDEGTYLALTFRHSLPVGAARVRQPDQ